MNYELSVLRALFRIARRRSLATPEDILVRVGGRASDVRRALAKLARSGLVTRNLEGPRLTLAGLAVAAACASPVGQRATTASAPRTPDVAGHGATNAKVPAVARSSSEGGRVIPLVRRHRAA